MTDPTTLGAYLRAARRRRRVSIQRAAEETRIRADFIVKMESDDFDFLATAYVRSFLKTYARFLRVEPEPLLERFDSLYDSSRADMAQIAALERRGRSVPRQRRLNSWATAAFMATTVIVVLAFVGLSSTPQEDRTGRDVATAEDTDETDGGSASSPSPESSPQDVAFTEGIDLKVVAATAPCWLEVYADGEQLFYQTLATGEKARFKADDKMFVRLGFPAGVELTVNGKNLGSPGGDRPIELLFPRDIEAAF